jgi:hypothetical protein
VAQVQLVHPLLNLREQMALQTLAVAAEVVATTAQQQLITHLVVQALSFFATPAQFNISLVAQLPMPLVMSFTRLHLQAHWLQQQPLICLRLT